ncbi:MAG: hypothetical protein G5Z42_01790 [Caldisphaeraceae archaeon]|nr:hypothetical protein [Caldisphaeraceae archaeon]MEB3691806.1 hypothetical protein [Caldisphaeraceae archaeon]MEB3797538.1 hypothetical protein [Caldisphaeraceae archaeon]
MHGLGFRDTWGSKIFIGIAIVIILIPIFLAYYNGFITASYSSTGSMLHTKTVINSCYLISSNENRSSLLSQLLKVRNGYASRTDSIIFLISGFAVIQAIARPLELRYAFLELTFSRRKYRLFLRRFGMAISILILAAFLEALTFASVFQVAESMGKPYISPTYIFSSTYIFSLESTLATLFSAAIISGALSLALRNYTSSFLAFFGLFAAIEVIGNLHSKLSIIKVLVEGNNAVTSIGGFIVFIIVEAFIFLLFFMGAERLEY